VFKGESGPSIFFVASFVMSPELPSELNSRSNLNGNIDELGFGESWLSRFSFGTAAGFTAAPSHHA